MRTTYFKSCPTSMCRRHCYSMVRLYVTWRRVGLMTLRVCSRRHLTRYFVTFFFASSFHHFKNVKRLKFKRYSSPEPVISELWGDTCHIGSHGVTFHRTRVNTSRLNPSRQAGPHFSYPGWVGLGGWLHTETVTHPSSRATSLNKTNALSLHQAASLGLTIPECSLLGNLSKAE